MEYESYISPQIKFVFKLLGSQDLLFVKIK
jgi:hypothetical protein